MKASLACLLKLLLPFHEDSALYTGIGVCTVMPDIGMTKYLQYRIHQ